MSATAEPAASAKPSLAGTLLVVALVLVLAWQLAYWTWVFIAPPLAPASKPASGGIDYAAIARLFGATADERLAGGAAAPPSGLRLKGVIAPTPGVAASAITVEVMPNPIRTSGALRLTAPAELKSVVTLYDETGRLVASLGEVTGSTTLTIDATGLASGTYTVRVRTEAGTELVERVTVAR